MGLMRRPLYVYRRDRIGSTVVAARSSCVMGVMRMSRMTVKVPMEIRRMYVVINFGVVALGTGPQATNVCGQIVQRLARYASNAVKRGEKDRGQTLQTLGGHRFERKANRRE